MDQKFRNSPRNPSLSRKQPFEVFTIMTRLFAEAINHVRVKERSKRIGINVLMKHTSSKSELDQREDIKTIKEEVLT